ncbi:diguanylate cyclase domain-containing protein [Streptomyces sp. E-08]|uniref:GGDEF domain-containing protein n=1 Tax=Streptomyces sp. E-08 TaxID=3404047 RepID=UPI003CE8FE9B
MGEDVRLRAVVALAQGMAAAHTPREFWRAAALGACEGLDGSFAALSVWQRDLGRLKVLVNAGDRAVGEEEFPDSETYPVHQFPEITEFLHEQWAGGGEPDAWVETAADPVATGRVTGLRRRGRGCCVVAPIVLHGRAWGELYVARPPEQKPFTRGDADFATVLAAVVAAGIAQAERLEEVRKLAFTDPLTGLANRRAVDTRLDEAIERYRVDGSVVSLVVCDLNGLKRVNDTHGHAVGDRLLERFGSVLSRCGAMLPGALAARLGGDEFCLLTVGPTADEVVAAAEELCVRAAELELGEGVACGVASTGDPIGPLRSARRLFRLADAAQYQAKADRSSKPVVAGRDGTVIRLADAPPGARDRRRFRDAPPTGPPATEPDAGRGPDAERGPDARMAPGGPGGPGGPQAPESQAPGGPVPRDPRAPGGSASEGS